MPPTNSKTTTGLGRLGNALVLLTLALLALRLLGVPPFQYWSWWRLTAPLWGAFAGLLALGALVGLCRLRWPDVD
ncbi:hypothetical protein MUN82_06385 [Hymenobacter aerilatus]|uniref:Uncharacterized protein n=1 Tax=Hymenobacter aerilatus TaxID=2932251 RepID=A0A8T9SWX2_9BACT|nr:hypothetical protein [Hymenobacter aerilatus]UOR06722.1 hypothetical protein MUN82_06385 [Hymenobacter aerilatus]